MINMKIENVDGKIIIYLFDKHVDINDIDALNKEIKNIFVRIMKRGSYDFFGYSKVNVYHNKYYGLILEVEKMYSDERCYKTIDLKIIIYKNVPMYIEFDDCYNFKLNEFEMINNKYYLDINSKTNLYKYIEYGKIKYKKITK